MTWAVENLEHLLSDIKPGFASGDDLDDGIFQLRMNNITTDGRLNLTKRRRIRASSQKLESSSLQVGDIVFNATNSPELVGKSAYIGALDEPTTFSNHFMRLRVNQKLAESQFVAKYLQHLFQLGAFQSLAKRWVNQAAISRASLQQLRIPLPPLPEQRRIASILDQADALRTERRRALSAIEDATDSIFIGMFGESDSAVVPVSELLADFPSAMRTGPFGSQLLHSEFVESGIPVLGIDNVVSNQFKAGASRFISESKFQQLKRFRVQPQDVLITIMGTVGRCAVVPNDIGIAINTKHLCCISLDQSKCLPIYLQQYFLRHPRARKYLGSVAKGAIMDGLNMGLIRELPVVLPSLSEQQIFVDRFSQLTNVREINRNHFAYLDELFASLQSRAFKGEL